MRFPVLPEAPAPNSSQIDEAASIGRKQRWPSPETPPRDRYFVSDKMPPVNPDLAQAKAIFQGQLDRLQTDYTGYYLLHNLSTKEGDQKVYEQNGLLDYLLEEKEAGRIRNLGWSFRADEECLDYVLGLPQPWDFAMPQQNYHDLLHEYEPQSFVASRITAPATPNGPLST